MDRNRRQSLTSAGIRSDVPLNRSLSWPNGKEFALWMKFPVSARAWSNVALLPISRCSAPLTIKYSPCWISVHTNRAPFPRGWSPTPMSPVLSMAGGSAWSMDKPREPMQVVPLVIRMIHRFYHAGGHQAAQRPAGAGLVDAKPGRQLGDAQRLLAGFDHQMDLQRRKARAVALLVQHAEFSDQTTRQCSEIPDVHN